MNRKFGKNDILLIGALLLLSALFLVLMTIFLQSGDKVLVTVDGEVYGTYSLCDEQEIEIKKDGKVTNVLEIKDGYARMKEADCPDRLCVHQKKIENDKESIVCLPNRIVVTVEAEEDNELDSVAR